MTPVDVEPVVDDPVAPRTFADIPPAELQKAILDYLPLVQHTVSELARRLPPNVQRDDLLAAGVFGLVDSLRRNGGEQGPAFAYYARVRIRGAIVDELRTQDWLSRRTRDRVTLSAEELGPVSFVGLDDLAPSEDIKSLRADDDPSAMAEAACTCRALASAIARLPERERRIVGRHYFDGARFKDIGAELGVSETRISQLHARALDQLRTLLDRAA